MYALPPLLKENSLAVKSCLTFLNDLHSGQTLMELIIKTVIKVGVTFNASLFDVSTT
jgi:hypothetical protein